MKTLVCLTIGLSGFLANPGSANAQRPFSHHNQDGFGQVSEMAQDSAGFLWISSTHFGRFDGYRLIEYTDSQGELIQGRITVSPGGTVWVHGRRLLHYDRQTDSFKDHGVETNDAFALAFDEAERLWLGIWGKGLALYDPIEGTIENFTNPEGDSVLNVNNRILDIWVVKNSLLLATTNGLWSFDRQKKTFSRPPNVNKSPFLSSTPVRRIYRGKDHYWFYKPVRLVKTDLEFNIIEQFDFPSDIKLDASIINVDRDKSGVFWIGSYGMGLLSFDPATGQTHRYQHDVDNPHSIASDIIQSVFVDRGQNVWIGTYDRGFDQLKSVSLTFHNAFLPGRASAGIPQVLNTPNGNYLLQESRLTGLWMASLGPDLNEVTFSPVHTDRNLAGLTTTNSFVGKQYWWVGTWEEGLFGIPLDGKTKLPGRGKMQRIVHDPGNAHSINHPSAGVWLEENDNLWLTSPQEVLFKIDLNAISKGSKAMTRFGHEPSDAATLSNGGVWGIKRIAEDEYWVLTGFSLDRLTNSGVEHVYKKPSEMKGFDCLTMGKDGSIYLGAFDGLTIGKKDGDRYVFREVDRFHNHVICFVEEDQLGRIWMGTEAGIFVYDESDGSSYQFKTDDGLPTNEFSSNGSTQTVDGRMIFGSIAQTIFDPLAFRPSTEDNLAQLTLLRVNNRPVIVNGSKDSLLFSIPESITTLQELELDYLHNVFTIEFSSLELSAPEKGRYRHRLDGFDNEWIETDSRDRSATYTNLYPGDYVFHVKASNRDQQWGSKERILAITVLPPPWRTWWAYAGYWMLGAGLLVLARRVIVQRERMKGSLKLAKVEQEREHFELEKAKEVDRVKTSFFTNISHEFRTPLTLIKGPVEDMLDQFKDDPKVQQRLKLVQRNSDLLLRLINQLLDLAKLESGTLKVEKTDGEIYSFIRGVAGSFESMARQKGITLNIEVPAGTLPARFDKDKVETILINLINNAIKFTPQGGEIRVMAVCGASPRPSPKEREKFGESSPPLPRRGDWGEALSLANLELSVSDTGIGIPAEHQSKIFERFHQVSEAHKEVGTGIGLSLVKELVALMGGEITVESESGKGSSFIVTLPIGPVSAEQLATEPKSLGSNAQNLVPSTQHLSEGISNVEVDPGKPQVLVVEDNADLRAFIIDSLGTEFQFHEAENGKIGLQIATEQIPDMIISDVMMPEMDGMEMTRRIKEDIKTSHIPLILLTAKSGEDSKLEGLSKGADDYLTKPFNKQELLLKVRNGTARMQRLREKMKTDVLSTVPNVEVVSQDEQFLNKVKETIIERMSDEQLSVESLADDIGMSRVQLYRKVSALTGMAVNELIRKLRLQRAAQLLQANWGPVSQVAYEVGFSNLSYFSKVFKEEFGVLPSEYERA